MMCGAQLSVCRVRQRRRAGAAVAAAGRSARRTSGRIGVFTVSDTHGAGAIYCSRAERSCAGYTPPYTTPAHPVRLR